MHISKRAQTAMRLGLVIALGIVLVKLYQPELALLLHPSAAHQEELVALVHQHDLFDTIFLVLTIALLCSIPFAPNSVVCIFAGVCFGPLFGFLINWCGNIMGNGLVAIAIRHSGISARIRQKQSFTYLTRQRFPVMGLTIGFIVPIVPNLLVNCAASGMQVSTRKYLLAVSLGTLPIAFLYALGGNALFTMSLKGVLVVLCLFIFLCLFYWGLKKLQGKLPN